MTNLLLSAGFNFSDYKAYIILAVLVIALVAWKLISSKKNKSVETKESESVSVVTDQNEATEIKEEPVNNEPVYTGYVTLEGLSEQDAATIMAITSHKTGIPLENLYFKSIKLLED